MGSSSSKLAKSGNAKIAENVSELIGNTPLVKLNLDPAGRYVTETVAKIRFLPRGPSDGSTVCPVVVVCSVRAQYRAWRYIYCYS